MGESDLEVSVISVYTECTVLQDGCQEGFGRTGFTVLRKTQHAVILSEAKNLSSIDVIREETKRDSSLRSESQNKSFFPQPVEPVWFGLGRSAENRQPKAAPRGTI